MVNPVVAVHLVASASAPHMYYLPVSFSYDAWVGPKGSIIIFQVCSGNNSCASIDPSKRLENATGPEQGIIVALFASRRSPFHSPALYVTGLDGGALAVTKRMRDTQTRRASVACLLCRFQLAIPGASTGSNGPRHPHTILREHHVLTKFFFPSRADNGMLI